MRYEEFLKIQIGELLEKGKISLADFPDMDIYMDQAANFMNKKLSLYKSSEKDQVITKTMIGNYVKHNMLPRPSGKKYTKDHMILLTAIYYLKGCFQMDEIESLMKPLIDNYNSEFDEKIDFENIYEGIMVLQENEAQELTAKIKKDIVGIKAHLKETGNSDDDMVELFTMIVSLSMKADMQKYLAHQLLQEYFILPKQPKQKK